MSGTFLKRTSFYSNNINSLLPKIEELRHIVFLTNAAVIGISDSKLDKLYPKIEIDGLNILRFDRNRHEGG